jgi:hypothetical protein
VVPWPLLALLLGILLAGGATFLTVQRLHALGVPAFVLAAVVIVAGIVGLVLHYKHEKIRAENDEGERPPPKLYRQASCKIERPLLEKLIQAEIALKQRVTEHGWDADWTAHQVHHDLAAKHLGQGDVVAAFRESCRGMRPLIESINRNRHKDDGLPPVWDKNGE